MHRWHDGKVLKTRGAYQKGMNSSKQNTQTLLHEPYTLWYNLNIHIIV